MINLSDFTISAHSPPVQLTKYPFSFSPQTSNYLFLDHLLKFFGTFFILMPYLPYDRIFFRGGEVFYFLLPCITVYMALNNFMAKEISF